MKSRFDGAGCECPGGDSWAIRVHFRYSGAIKMMDVRHQKSSLQEMWLESASCPHFPRLRCLPSPLPFPLPHPPLLASPHLPFPPYLCRLPSPHLAPLGPVPYLPLAPKPRLPCLPSPLSYCQAVNPLSRLRNPCACSPFCPLFYFRLSSVLPHNFISFLPQALTIIFSYSTSSSMLSLSLL